VIATLPDLKGYTIGDPLSAHRNEWRSATAQRLPALRKNLAGLTLCILEGLLPPTT
jgi:hypothetical protein